MIEVDPGKVSAHYIEPATSLKTGTEVEVEPIRVHKAAPIEETEFSTFDDCIPFPWVRKPQPCFKVDDIRNMKPQITHE